MAGMSTDAQRWALAMLEKGYTAQQGAVVSGQDSRSMPSGARAEKYSQEKVHAKY